MPKQQIEIDNTKTHLEEKLASYFGVTPSDASITWCDPKIAC